MELTENNFEIGEATLMPVLFMIGGQSKPEKNGFAGHGYFGLGYSFNDFEKGSGIKDIEKDVEELARYYGYNLDVLLTPEIEDSIAVAFGFGGDYFFTKNIALTFLDVRFLFMNADVDWEVKVDGDGSVGKSNWTDKLHLSNMQFLAGLTFWF